jgi:hypothetical protein
VVAVESPVFSELVEGGRSGSMAPSATWAIVRTTLTGCAAPVATHKRGYTATVATRERGCAAPVATRKRGCALLRLCQAVVNPDFRLCAVGVLACERFQLSMLRTAMFGGKSVDGLPAFNARAVVLRVGPNRAGSAFKLSLLHDVPKRTHYIQDELP